MVEVEADDFNTPDFLRTSVLDVKMAQEVVAVMKEVSARRAEVDQVEIVKGDHGEEPERGDRGTRVRRGLAMGKRRGWNRNRGRK